MLSTPASSILATKTPAVKESPSAIAVKKKHFADMRSPPTGQERQKYNLITFITLKKLT